MLRVRPPLRTARIAILAACALIAGCDFDSDTDNGRVTVRNRTDQEVLVVYDQEVDACCCCDDVVWSEDRSETIRPGQRAVIYVDSLFWDGRVDVRYDGRWRRYDLDFDVLGFAEVDVEIDDFAPSGPG